MPHNPSRRDHPGWLLLLHQLPTRPASARIRTWRRLQQIGSVPFKNSAYVLPNTPEAREDFEWLCTEIRHANGQAAVLAAEALSPDQDEEIREAFRAARSAEFAALAEDAAAALRSVRQHAAGARQLRHQRTLRGFRDELSRLQAIDFCGAPARVRAEKAVAALARRMTPAAVRYAADKRR